MDGTAKKSGCVIVAAIVALPLFVFLAYLAYANHRGESGAHSLCDSIKLGDTRAAVRAKMLAAPGSVGRVFDVHDDPSFPNKPDFVAVDFPWALVERYACVADLSKGKVAVVRIVHLD